MTKTRTFFSSMAVSASICCAVCYVNADSDDTPAQPLATPAGIAVVDDCEITGHVEQRNDGIYLVLEATNPTVKDHSPSLDYVVTCTPGAGMMSRMMPVPKEIKRDGITFELPSCHNRTDEILLAPSPLKSSVTETAVPTRAKTDLQVPARTPDTWVVTVARGEIAGAAGWGALVPSVQPAERTVLENGQMVLAKTRIVALVPAESN